MPAPGDDALLRGCELLEECYEFTLAYAAQGHGPEPGSAADVQVRERLTRAATVAGELARIDTATLGAFARVVADDAKATCAALELVLAQPAISSAMVDSLNASLHLRALLADVFLLAETLEARQATPAPADR